MTHCANQRFIVQKCSVVQSRVGRMLMGAVEKRARAEGITRLTWAVHKNNTAALRFYEALGAQYSEHSYVMRLDLVGRPR